MAEIKDEILSIRAFIKPDMPTTKFFLENMPIEPAPDQMTIDFVDSGSEDITGMHYRVERTYQAVYFGETKLDCLSKMGAIESRMKDKRMIPILGAEARYLRIGSFSLSKPFKANRPGVFGIIGMLDIYTHEARTQETYDKILAVHSAINEEE